MKIEWNRLDGKTIKDKGVGEERYRILDTIGEGGAGKVYLAYDIFEDKQVAIKTADPKPTMSNADVRFKMEADILSKLHSPYVIEFFDYFTQDDIQMIVMEYVEGVSLESKLKKEKIVSSEEAIKITKQLLEALQEVHSHEVFHRDIKPDNIHITVEGNVKLLDFGIVQESEDQDLTKEGSVIGTISYMSPEIITSKDKIANPRTDIYSVGVMLYELITGVKPFNAKAGLVGMQKNNDLARDIVFNPAIPPVEVDGSIDENLSNFVMRLIDKDPYDRYQNTQEALEDLNKLVKGGEIAAFDEYGSGKISANKQIIILSAIAASFVVAFVLALILALI